MGGGDVILDISDYIEPENLVQHKRKGKAVEEFKEYLADSQPHNGLDVEVILDEEPASDVSVTAKLDVAKSSENSGGGKDEKTETVPDTGGTERSDIVPDTGTGIDTDTDIDAGSGNLDPVEEPTLDLDDLSTFGEIEEADVLVAKETEGRQGDYESNARLFNVLLSQFRRNPSLAGIDSITLQLGQDQVVEPVAVRRLIAQVQSVIEVHEKHTPNSTRIFDQFFDKNFNCLSTALFKPLIYDTKTIYTSHVSANTENDHTIRYEQKADILNDLIENFKHPLVHRGKKPYSTSTLYNTIRKAYVRKDTPFDVFEAHTPVNDFTKHPDGSIHPGYTPIFSTEHDTQRCVSSARPERYFDMASTFTAYRVSENVDVTSLEGTDARFAIEKREVSYPVLQAQFDEDDDSLALRNIIPGESISIIGFVVDRNQTLDRTSVVHVGNDQKEIERLIDSGEQFVVLCPNQLANVLGILAPSPAEISRREEEKLRRCFNFESANAILSPYKLDIYSVDHVTITDIRSRITRNIIDLIDYVAATHSKYAKKLRAEFLEERRLNFFSNMPGLVTEALGSSLILTDTDDMEFLGRLKSIGGAEQLYCLAIGIQYRDELTDVEVELKSLIIRARVLTGETSEAASYSDMLEFVRNPEKALKKRNKQKCVKTLQRRIEFLEETSKILEKIAETGWQHVVDEAVSRVAFIDRRQKEGRSSKTLVADAKTIEDFSLSLNEESDENEGDSDAVSPANYISEYSPNVLPSYFLSPELQSKLIADSSVRLQDHFTARPLLLIARQINTMLHPNKLSCHMSIQEIKAMVYDISELCDESFSLFERRAFVQELMMSNGMERQEAFGEWKKLVGGELDVKTQKRVSVVLARLMLQLELQRPLHSFRKIFPIGGQKSIGKDSQSSFESYTPDNKVKYIVTVAAQTADLGREGRLMTDYQASDLKNIYAYTTSYYDKFLRKPSLIAMKAVADKADQIQTTLLTEKTKTQIPHGYTLVQSEESMKPLLDRLEAYNVALQSLIHRLEIQGGDFAELIAVQRALRKKIYFLVVSSLASIQRQIDGTDESEWNEVSTSAYNPDKYGDEKSTACQPGEVCILTTFIDLANIRSRVREELRESETVLKSLKTRLYFVRFPRRNTSPTYDFRRFNPITVTNPTEVLRQRVRPGRPHERAKRAPDVSVLDNLVEILASKTGKDERWRIAFSAKLSDLGKRYLSSGVGLGLLKQFYRSLRTDIQLLSSHLYVTVNSYEMVRDKDGGQTESRSGGSFHQPGDTMEIITARGTIYQMKKLARLESRIYVEEKRQEWDVLYYNREDNYLTKYLTLARPLQGYTNAEDFASVVAISPDKSVESYENTHEAMLCSLTTELLNCCNHVLRQNPDAIEVANFSIDFLKRCFKRQDDVEINTERLQNMQDRSYERYLKEVNEQSKERSEELWTFRKVGINVEFGDDVAEDDQSAWITTTSAVDNIDDNLEVDTDDVDLENSREDFDMVDDENRMNLFNDDE